jgi:hypothetical protein
MPEINRISPRVTLAGASLEPGRRTRPAARQSNFMAEFAATCTDIHQLGGHGGAGGGGWQGTEGPEETDQHGAAEPRRRTEQAARRRDQRWAARRAGRDRATVRSQAPTRVWAGACDLTVTRSLPAGPQGRQPTVPAGAAVGLKASPGRGAGKPPCVSATPRLRVNPCLRLPSWPPEMKTPRAS